jgi:hypothetical protein
MMRFGLREGGTVCLVILSLILGWRVPALAYNLDKDGTIRLGVRTYVNARVGAEKTDKGVFVDQIGGENVEVLRGWTFPESAAGHLRQNRFFIETELKHDVTKLMREGFGPLALLNHMPFRVRSLAYNITYRGEGDGIYDWGPREYRDRSSYYELGTDVDGVFNPPSTCALQSCPEIDFTRSQLHKRGSNRHRLFQAAVDIAAGDWVFKIGRQILVWGETDAFRLIDNINPVDSSFGGFLISLDERRVPIDMIRASYYLGEYGDWISEADLEMFAAIDNDVSFYPGTPAGSPWTLPNLGDPSGTTDNFIFRPARTIENTRGGARLRWNVSNATFSIAHYYTYHDNPTVQSCVAPGFPLQRISTQPGGSGNLPGCPVGARNLPISHPDGQNPFASENAVAPLAYTIQQPARIQISGITSTFNVPAAISRRLGLSGEPIVRTELAYFKDEPAFTQNQIDPFSYHFLTNQAPGQFLNNLNTGGILKKDSINFVLGLDTNQFFRFLNPGNSFFITTQFFYKHIKKIDEDIFNVPGRPTRAVLPVPAYDVAPTGQETLGAVQPVLVAQDANQFLQTLLISTSYRSGTVLPSLTLFYDWSGSFVFIPSVTFVYDPFRFTLQGNYLESHALRGNSGTSLLRDRDNVLFQLEYVI